jgi:hypothetical protein
MQSLATSQTRLQPRASQFARASGQASLEQTATARLELYKSGQVLRE